MAGVVVVVASVDGALLSFPAQPCQRTDRDEGSTTGDSNHPVAGAIRCHDSRPVFEVVSRMNGQIGRPSIGHIGVEPAPVWMPGPVLFGSHEGAVPGDRFADDERRIW